MFTVENTRFIDDLVFVDGKSFIGCNFKNCQIVFSGYALPSFQDCKFDGCDWRLAGAAQDTLIFLRGIHHGCDGESPAAKFIDEITRSNVKH
ncbi:TPA: hypothetical protein ACTW9A_002434 [Raoultella planticola]